MDISNNESRTIQLFEIIKPDLLQILEYAPAYGSCGIDIFFHNSEIVRIVLRSEHSKLIANEK